ncbi:hypothetical protein [Devosia sp. Leaf64]|uniref:hypothetical protein n=1 Tax=Devosia sp. Leaf64 TaxID=1736229 RepID=UPI000714F9C2|nr:hypothetical protein [Devosia sp. Leaf64]KQN75082.1 hypothetical protein ASE94_01825 [Devosia sp. Leaf64]
MTIHDNRRESDAFYYVTPSPEKVAQIVDRYGAFAAAERWGWLSNLQLTDLYRRGRKDMTATLNFQSSYG